MAHPYYFVVEGSLVYLVDNGYKSHFGVSHSGIAVIDIKNVSNPVVETKYRFVDLPKRNVTIHEFRRTHKNHTRHEINVTKTKKEKLMFGDPVGVGLSTNGKELYVLDYTNGLIVVNLPKEILCAKG